MVRDSLYIQSPVKLYQTSWEGSGALGKITFPFQIQYWSIKSVRLLSAVIARCLREMARTFLNATLAAQNPSCGECSSVPPDTVWHYELVLIIFLVVALTVRDQLLLNPPQISCKPSHTVSLTVSVIDKCSNVQKNPRKYAGTCAKFISHFWTILL